MGGKFGREGQAGSCVPLVLAVFSEDRLGRVIFLEERNWLEWKLTCMQH